KPIQTIHKKMVNDSMDWGSVHVELPKPLAHGDYIAVSETEAFDHQKAYGILWFTVTDLGLIIKQAPDKTLVQAIDLNTFKPQANVNVNLYDRDNPTQVLGTVTTHENGLGEYQWASTNQKRGNYNLLAYGTSGENHAYAGVYSYASDTDSYKTYFYTERPIYRLGQTVYFRGISRQVTLEGFKNPGENLPIDISIEDPDNNKLTGFKVNTDAHGSFHGTFEIPTEGKTGGYQVTLTYPDQTTSTQSIEVAQYRKPEYLVEVLPKVNQVTQGDSFKARIRASYYFGAPVTHARVKYSIYSSNDWDIRYQLMNRPEYYGFFDSWTGSPSYSDYGYSGDYVSEGYAETDENGEALVEIATQPNSTNDTSTTPYSVAQMAKKYKIQAEVTDISRMTVTGSNTVSVLPGDFSFFITPKRSVYKVGETIEADIKAVDYKGKTVPNQNLTAKVVRMIYHTDDYSYEEKTVQDPVQLTTNSEGTVHFSFKPAESWVSDTYSLVIEGTDKNGKHITESDSVWIASENNLYFLSENNAQKQPFTLKLDKQVYQPGETAKVIISGPFTGKEGMTALVAIEGSTLHSYQLQPLNASAVMVEVPVLANQTPNVYITVDTVGPKHQYYHASEMIRISPEDHFLKVVVTTNKEKYHPGDTVEYTLQATQADGKPAKDVELSLGVVDESIYAIRGEVAEDIRKFFYQQRENWVATVSSFPEEYSGGPDKIEPRVRKDFRDMAAWFPDLVTNEQGIARVSVKLPDNLTTWRATVRGISLSNDVGAGLNKIISTQDLLVRLALPRFYTQGDEGYLTAAVHNYTDTPQSVELTLTPSEQFSISDNLVQKVTIEPDKATQYSWPTKIVKTGKGLIAVKAVGQTAGDAMELSIPINPLAIEAFEMVSGVLNEKDSDKMIDYKLPPEASPESAKINVSWSPSSIGPVIGNFSKLIDYPYGCTEQTMSRLVPSIIAVNLHNKLGVPLDSASQAKFQTVYKKSLNKLYEHQHGDGGWGWWMNDESGPYLTGYVLEGVSLLKEAGYAFDPSKLQSALKWSNAYAIKLEKQLTSSSLKATNSWDQLAIVDSWTDLAYLTYASTLHGAKISSKVESTLLSASLGKTVNFSPVALAYVSLAAKRTNNQALLKTFYPQLLAQCTRKESYQNWTVGPYDYRYTDVEATALGLRAVMAIEPEKTEKIEALKQWLLLQRDKDGWFSTKATALVLRVLMEEEILHKNKGSITDSGAAPNDTFTLVMTSAENELLSSSFSPETLYQPEKSMEILLKNLTTPSIHWVFNGVGRLYYQSLFTYMLPLTPGKAVPVPSKPDGLKIHREFYRLEPMMMTSTGQIRFKSKLISDNTLKAGETVLMKVFVETPVNLPYVMLEVPLPSGGEVVQDDPKENLISTGD
ncbi:MAG: hypothetical protein K2X66_07520, partial [Cyanobacteria bacterium]|nr:hypothetical protein [Cyanobacteriota bacterium]